MPDLDHSERVLNALEESIRVTAEVQGYMKGLGRDLSELQSSSEREFAQVREKFGSKINELEMEMRTTNAHLDNLVRATEVTNELLREDMEDRQRREEHRRAQEEKEREWKRQMEERRIDRKEEVEDDNRNLFKKYLDEGWAVVKHPLAYLAAGIIFWFVTQYFRAPPQELLLNQNPVPQLEEKEP